MQGDQKKFRDILLDTTLELTAIDREQMLTTLSEAGLNSPTLKHDKQKGLRFSFVRSETEETEAISQLSAALEALRGLAECNAALDLAETRMKSEFTSEAFADQQRLLEVKRDINQRLASLAGND